jgi:proline iminopeptidase
LVPDNLHIVSISRKQHENYGTDRGHPHLARKARYARDVRTAILGLILMGQAACPPPPLPPAPTTAPLSEGDYAITVDGIPLAYHVRGRGPVCIVHPGGPGFEWSYLRMPEVERALTLVYLEPVGTGVSQPTPPLPAAQYTLARYAKLLDGVRDQFGLSRVCVLGHSHGGMVAVNWAAANPDRVAGLILYATAARADPETRKDQETAIAAYAKEPWFPAVLAAMERYAKITTDAEADAVVRDWAPLMFAEWTNRQAELAPWLATLRAFAAPIRGEIANQTPWDARDKLALVRAPTLVIAGARDARMSPARADELVRAIAGAQLVVLQNSGHMGHIEEPAAFAAAIAEFAPKLEAASAPPRDKTPQS